MSTKTNESGAAASILSMNQQKAMKVSEVVLVRINAQITEQQHQKIKIHATKNNKTVRELIGEFIDTLPDVG